MFLGYKLWFSDSGNQEKYLPLQIHTKSKYSHFMINIKYGFINIYYKLQPCSVLLGHLIQTREHTIQKHRS